MLEQNSQQPFFSARDMNTTNDERYWWWVSPRRRCSISCANIRQKIQINPRWTLRRWLRCSWLFLREFPSEAILSSNAYMAWNCGAGSLFRGLPETVIVFWLYSAVGAVAPALNYDMWRTAQ